MIGERDFKLYDIANSTWGIYIHYDNFSPPCIFNTRLVHIFVLTCYIVATLSYLRHLSKICFPYTSCQPRSICLTIIH